MFRTVTLPLALPGLANAFLLLFAASLADFATPLILAGNSFPVLPTEAYLQITGLFDLKGGAVMSLLLLVPAALVYFVQRYWVERGHYVTISGKAGPQSAHPQRDARGARGADPRSASPSRSSSSISTCCCCMPRWSSPSAPTTPGRSRTTT